MKRAIVKLSNLLLFVFGFSSCQNVIHVDLNSASPQIVIEGSITDQPGPYTIKLSKTVNFSETNVFPPVSGAVVSISDNVGNSEIFTETFPGTYSSSILQGVPGRTYTLDVISSGKNYSAVSTMSYPVEIDTLIIEKSFFGDQRFVSMLFQDSVGIKNYYRFVEVINGTPRKSIFTMDDYLQDGEMIFYTLFSDEDSLTAGDSVAVLLQSIDKNVFNYFNMLFEVSGGGDPSSSPANPTSNINNGALGYFSAYSLRSKSIVVP